MNMFAEEIDRLGNELDAELTTSPAKSLPDGWKWYEWDDGSGHLESPDRETYFSFDMQTQEYEHPKTRKTEFMPGYPCDKLSRSSFKEIAEKWANDHIVSPQTAQQGRDKSITSQLADFKPAPQAPGRTSRAVALERS